VVTGGLGSGASVEGLGGSGVTGGVVIGALQVVVAARPVAVMAIGGCSG
jgi:hypothetical protein